MDDLQALWTSQAKQLGLDKPKLLDHYENEIQEHWQRFTDKKNGIDKLRNNQKNSLSKIACFEALASFFGEGRDLSELGL